jgi:hypothetical protein
MLEASNGLIPVTMRGIVVLAIEGVRVGFAAATD